MSGTIIRIDELGDAIRKEIDAMNHEVIEKCNKAAEKAANDGVKQLKASSPVRADGYNRKYPPGSYAKSWTKKKREMCWVCRVTRSTMPSTISSRIFLSLATSSPAPEGDPKHFRT